MSQSIYEEIGGQDAVETVVEDFYDQVLADDQLVGFFDGMDMNELRTHQVQFISSVAGGPIEYSGDEMREAHSHLDIREDDFELVAEYLKQALQSNGVTKENVESIMSEVATFEDPILDR